MFFAGTGKKTKKRNRNERRLSFRKGLNHNPETLKQFSSLGIEPPASILGVEEVIGKLRDKLSSLEMQAAETKLARLKAHGIPESQATNGVTDKAVEIPEITVDRSCIADAVLENSTEVSVNGQTESKELCLDLTNSVTDIDKRSGEIPAITVDRSCVDGAVLKNSEDSLRVSVNGQADRKALSLDLKFPCIPEIRVQNSPQGEVENKDCNNTHDEIPTVLITTEDSESSHLDSVCDRSEPPNNPRSAL